ncbi:MAG: bifunctional 4-hydroxy-2-oxoglutarate aldolase/2-dehydro-3-deoxy-phosphogluconate aldolase [Aerococcaceae bacterium]|nr:bifunctional 4-hydroxy-2-oxoglutarate aldolase/2-dehydro-3-deoxy-phosphogluconate aldolase [Aerococcaceae bacterium]
MEKQLREEKLLPLYTVTDLSLLPILEEILLNNQLHFIEITYRSALASAAIKQLSDSNKLIVGAGTVCNLENAKDAIENGAKFIVMPGLNKEVITYCQSQNIPVFPGAVTPTEIIEALNLGLNTVKFFPANLYGGINAIKNLTGPFPDLNFIPTGGIDSHNVLEYVTHKNIVAAGGSFIISEKTIQLDNGKTANEQLKELVSKIK